MSLHLLLAACSACFAFLTRSSPLLLMMFGGVAAWELLLAFRHPLRHPSAPVVLRLAGLTWRMDDFCRGWLITGQTGSGKTAAAINTMLWQVSKNCPTWGGVYVDDKGVYWETLRGMFRHLGREDDLILLQVRPSDAPPDWRPAHTFNFLDNPHLPWSAKAKIVCDVASALGQRNEQSFFRMQAQVQMEFAFRVLNAVQLPVTLQNAYEFLTSDLLLEEIMTMIAARKSSESDEAASLVEHYQSALASQPPQQLGGVKTTIANYLQVFTDPDIAAVFCPPKSSFNFDTIDHGKVVCVALPQRFHVERRTINTLLKLTFYSHALRRFDRPAAQRTRDNLLIFWADEAQKIVTASEDGMSDYNVVDVIREARATVVAATQSYTSLIPPMGDEQKAKVFIANMANRITFSAADEDSAKIAADTLGKRKAKKRTEGYSAGKRTTSWTDEDKYFVEPHELRRLRKFEAIVQHCESGFRRAKIPPLGTDGREPVWYR
ncbi:hypothetical protein OPIT5_23305 [Opitutaceae bacterium TAV5]|nr:hypothetical protein OPIT5_23305 [Opitutaceae bacterium TAV5]